MSHWRLCAILSAAVLAIGCSSVKEELKPAKLEPVEVEYRLVSNWSRNTGAGQDDRYQRLNTYINDDKIFAVDVKGSVTAVTAEKGKKLWSTSVKAEIGGGVGGDRNQLYLGSLDGEVIALSQEDGAILWKAQASSEIVSSPAANGDVVVASAIDGRIFAFDAETGKLRWSYDHPMPVLSLRANADPLIQGDDLFVSFDNGQLLKFNASNGQLRWAARVGQPQGKTEIERLVDVDARPLLIEPFVYGAGFNGRVVAINRGTGRISWAQDTSTFHNPTLADGKIIISEADSHIKAFDRLTGNLEWENDKIHRRSASSPSVLDDIIIVFDENGVVHGLNANDGNFVLRSKFSDRVLAQPQRYQNNLIVLTEDGRLASYSIKKLKKPQRVNIQGSSSGDTQVGRQGINNR